MNQHVGTFPDSTDLNWARIRTLNERVWEGRVDEQQVRAWLINFTGKIFSVDRERELALFLLAHFTYFGDRELRELLKSVFRDLFRYPIVQAIRKANAGTTDQSLIDRGFRLELAATRFLGMGNPSESGAHLLYYFRQENRLSRNLFVHQNEVLTEAQGSSPSSIAINGLRRLVFIDDVLGSGQQAEQYSARLIDDYKKAAARDKSQLEVNYHVLFAKPQGLTRARSTLFDSVTAVHTMDASETVFSTKSRLLPNLEDPSILNDIRSLALKYGAKIFPGAPLGYGNGQLLLGFHHNTPDNSLPIFWTDDININWQAIFPRYPKVE